MVDYDLVANNSQILKVPYSHPQACAYGPWCRITSLVLQARYHNCSTVALSSSHQVGEYVRARHARKVGARRAQGKFWGFSQPCTPKGIGSGWPPSSTSSAPTPPSPSPPSLRLHPDRMVLGSEESGQRPRTCNGKCKGVHGNGARVQYARRLRGTEALPLRPRAFVARSQTSGFKST